MWLGRKGASFDTGKVYPKKWKTKGVSFLSNTCETEGSDYLEENSIFGDV